MIRKSLLLAAGALIGAALTGPASAHNQWLLPSITVLSDTNQTITVDAGASTHAFEPNHAALGLDGIKVRQPDGSEGKIDNATRLRNRSVFDVAIDKEGTWRIGNVGENIGGRFKVNGEDWIVGRRRGPPPGAMAGGASAPAGRGAPAGPGGPGGRGGFDPSHMVSSVDEIPAGATDLDLTESLSTNEFFVTAGAPSPESFKPSGKGLEFVPETLPTDLVAGEAAKFRFLIDGKPAAGLKIEVVPGPGRFYDAADKQEVTTDSAGAVSITWPKPGFYWLNTSTEDDKPSDSRASKRRLSYTVTLEVVAP